MDLKSEVEAWKFMSSIIPSKHQETTHLPKGAWSQNAYANNIGQLTASRREKHPTKDKNTTSRKCVLKERDIQETGTKPPNDL